MPTQQGFLHSSGKALAGRLERSIEAGRQHLAQCLRVKREESAVTNSSLAGKVALVTGAGNGVGRALALTCDVSREADTVAAANAAREKLGPVRVLVNAAATIDRNANVLELAPDDWDRIFAVNVKGAFLMSRAVLPMMIAAGGG